MRGARLDDRALNRATLARQGLTDSLGAATAAEAVGRSGAPRVVIER